MLTQETHISPSELGESPVEQAVHCPWVLQLLQLVIGQELTQLVPLSRKPVAHCVHVPLALQVLQLAVGHPHVVPL